MESVFKICKIAGCGISVIGLEQDSNYYLSSEQVSTRNYTWEQTVTLNALFMIDSKEEETLESHEVVPHTDIDSVDFELNKDGLYKVKHIIIPTQIWYEYVLARDPLSLDEYSAIYFFDTTQEKFCKAVSGNVYEVCLEEILEVNNETTTLIESTNYGFELCHLKDCFFKICKNLLENLPCECTNAKDFKQDILNRDIIWMVINVVTYLIQKQQYYKAQSILEQVETCWGICGSLDKQINGGGSNCGCTQ